MKGMAFKPKINKMLRMLLPLLLGIYSSAT